MKTKMKLRKILDEKDNTYVFSIPYTFPEEPMDIIAQGRLLAYRLGNGKFLDALGNEMGTFARRYNGVDKLKICGVDPEVVHTELSNRVKEAKGLMTKDLTQPLIKTYQGEKVHIGQYDKKPYIMAKKKCAACPTMIDGYHYLELNDEGLKVIKMSPFVPLLERVSKAGTHTNKLLCPDCAVKTTKIEHPPEPPVDEDTYEILGITEQLTGIKQLEKELLEICKTNTPTVDGEYLRGLMYAYMLLKEDHI